MSEENTHSPNMDQMNNLYFLSSNPVLHSHINDESPDPLNNN